MIDRLRATFGRHRRAIIAAFVIGIAWCTAIEAWLPRDDSADGRIDAVMVLSSGVREDGTLEPNAEARLRRGADVAMAMDVPLYVSRVRRQEPPLITSDSGQKRIADSSHLSRWTVLAGVAINTRDEAERLKRVLPTGSIAVVTSRLHTRRACATFEKLGYSVRCISSGREWPIWKTPYFVLYESAAWIKYRVKGWT